MLTSSILLSVNMSLTGLFFSNKALTFKFFKLTAGSGGEAVVSNKLSIIFKSRGRLIFVKKTKLLFTLRTSDLYHRFINTLALYNIFKFTTVTVTYAVNFLGYYNNNFINFGCWVD